MCVLYVMVLSYKMCVLYGMTMSYIMWALYVMVVSYIVWALCDVLYAIPLSYMLWVLCVFVCCVSCPGSCIIPTLYPHYMSFSLVHHHQSPTPDKISYTKHKKLV
jgi:hypothetical protein